MEYRMLNAKLHLACVTHAELDYDGSCAIDSALLEAANIQEYEQIQIYNVTNGERFTTYAISAERGSKIISVNGAAAHKVSVGDLIIIAHYSDMPLDDALLHKPKLVYVDENNRVTHLSNKLAANI